LRFDPAGERRFLGAPPVVERSRHILGTTSRAAADRSRPDLPVHHLLDPQCGPDFLHSREAHEACLLPAYVGVPLRISPVRAAPRATMPLQSCLHHKSRKSPDPPRTAGEGVGQIGNLDQAGRQQSGVEHCDDVLIDQAAR
jgi:hypothetical protein